MAEKNSTPVSNDMQIQAINKAFSWYMLQREKPDKKS